MGKKFFTEDSLKTLINTIKSLLDGKASSSHNHSISNITNLQSSLDGKQNNITGAATTIASSDLTANRALVSNSSGKVAVSAVTSTELGYLDGVTSAVQTQLDGKAASSHTHSISNITNLQTTLDNKAAQADLNSHTSDTTVHITNAERANWNAAESNSIAAANSYTDDKIANLLENSTEAIDSIFELRDAMEENADAISALETIAAGHADKIHTHKVEDITDITVDATEINYLDGVTSNVQTQLDGKSNSGHTHDDKMDKNNPTGTGSFSLNRKAYSDIGNYSFAEGYNTISSGEASHAEGTQTIASGSDSHAEGFTTEASSIASHSEGYKTIASGYASHAEGGQMNEDHSDTLSNRTISATDHPIIGTVDVAISSTTAQGVQSHAEGTQTFAFGYSSHAEGYKTNALGNESHTEGISTYAIGSASHAEGQNSLASGNYSHAEGNGTIAEGISSHAEGGGEGGSGRPKASGDYSHAEGYGEVLASGTASHAEGRHTTASGEVSHAEGYYTRATGIGAHAEGGTPGPGSGLTTASGDYSHAEGYGSIASGTASHAEGCSTASGIFSHAEGGDVYYNEKSGSYSTLTGGGPKAEGLQSHAEGTQTTASGEASHAEGYITIASEKGSHAEGCNTIASGMGAHAEGGTSGPGSGLTTASGDYSHAEGYSTKASGQASHAEGSNTNASGDASHAEGGNLYYDSKSGTIKTSNQPGSTTASGLQSHAEGYRTDASGEDSHTEGYETTASGLASHAEGYQTKASGSYSHTKGYKTQASGTASHAEGSQTLASGYTSHAEGYHTFAIGDYSHVEGDATGYEIYPQLFTSTADEKVYNITDPNGNATTKPADLNVGDYICFNGTSYVYYLTIDSIAKITAISDTSMTLDKTLGTQTKAIAYKIYGLSSGKYSHSEGTSFTAGDYSHAEGYSTSAYGNYSHAEGNGTIAYAGQHVEGSYNIPDTERKYLHIVGNGSSGVDRSNAHTLDKNGNAWFAGGVTATSFNGFTVGKSVPSNAVFTDTKYSAGTGISLSGTTINNSGVRSIGTGTANGTISVNTNGKTTNVAVKGLGSAAYTASTAYATSGHNHDSTYSKTTHNHDGRYVQSLGLNGCNINSTNGTWTVDISDSSHGSVPTPWVNVTQFSGGHFLVQIAIKCDNDSNASRAQGAVWIRNKYMSGAWSQWRQI